MITITTQAILCLCTLAAFLIDAGRAADSPKVFGMDFKKSSLRNTPNINRLRRRQKTVSVEIDNTEIEYLINITIGTPPQEFSVQLDTGSADLWIPSVASDICLQDQEACANGALDPNASTTLVDIGHNTFQIQYEDNTAISGDYITDTVAIGKTAITNMTMGLATQATSGLGIMGIGYNADESILDQDPTAAYPNIIAQLKNNGDINTLAYSLWLNDLNSLTGSILFGGVDTAKYHGNLAVLPVQKAQGGGPIQETTVALSTISLADGSGKVQYSKGNLSLPAILDSGTMATYVPDSIAQDILNGVGATNDLELGAIIPCIMANSPATFSFTFGGPGGPAIAAAFKEFVVPIYSNDGSQPQFQDGTGPICAFGLQSSGSADQPILLGDTFLRSAYVVYNLANNQVGIAQTNFNATDSHVVEISGTAIPGASTTATGSALPQSYTGHPLQTDANTQPAIGQFAGGHQTATFTFLGVTATSTAKGLRSHSGADAALGAAPIGAVTVAAAFVLVVSMLFGGSIVMFR